MMNPYEILVNKENPVPEDFLEYVELVPVKGTKDRLFQIERETLAAYESLRDFVKDKTGVIIGVGNAYRSIEQQQMIYERFCWEFGPAYANKIVAPVGRSEHHTGLGVDLELFFEGEGFISNNHNFDRISAVFEKHVHPHLADFGFILRYPEGKEHITGVKYEPWHYRYVGKEAAKEIMSGNLCLEEYLEKYQK